VIHRLSNAEYDNTIGELLGTELRFGADFVHEEAEGFDNIATALSMSPRQIEGYFAAAGELAAEAFAVESIRERLGSCTLDAVDMTCAEEMISSFGTRAFRRPLQTTESDWLLAVYEQALSLGETADGAMQEVIRVVLSSPQFLYRIEFDPDPSDPEPHALSSYELASRLSYALWASMPDEALFALAESGELLVPEVLEAEVDRMLAEDRADTLATNFAAQWLGGERLDLHVASPTVYPSWTPELRLAMQRELELYVMEFLRGELPYSDFLSADFNYVDATLATHYGFAPPAGDGFTRVENTDDERHGFLGLAGFLTHTSRETRTSPIIRGTWILDALWCTALELPEDLVVDPLPEPEDGSTPTTVRELIATHRADPACAVCHDFIDPIGLSLEHFDGIGQYRDTYESGVAVDASGELPGDVAVDGLPSLAEALAADSRFVPCAAKKFNAYALGRASSDPIFIESIVADWTARGLTLPNLIKASVLSENFQERRAVAQ
jgi:hypothetical protein